VRSVSHAEAQPCFDQGEVGSCTANAALGVLVSEPFAVAGRTFTEDDAVSLYSLETRLDDTQIPGEYPPDDTGSSGPWSMMALEKQGLIKSFRHTRSAQVALRMLADGPISIGVPWYQSMFTPDETGRIVVDQSSELAGGHQVCVVAVDAEAKTVRIRNSWGTAWGDQGHALLSWDDLHTLFAEGGDAVQPKA
jgi:C1A family cysteine protease